MNARSLPDPRDIALFGLDLDARSRVARFTLMPPLARPDGALYGGTGIGVSIAAMEAATGRPTLWVTTQFVATAYVDSTIELTTDVLAEGRAVSQVQVVARHEGRTLFVSLGSVALPRPGGFAGQFEVMPEVAGPGVSAPMFMGPSPSEAPRSFNANVEFRVAEVLATDGTAPHMALWARLSHGRQASRAGLSFLADMVPPAIARAAGTAGGGPSLDNSLRFGDVPDGLTWVLLDLRGHVAHGAHAHGSVRIWSPDGRLLAVGGQSANMMSLAGPATAT